MCIIHIHTHILYTSISNDTGKNIIENTTQNINIKNIHIRHPIRIHYQQSKQSHRTAHPRPALTAHNPIPVCASHLLAPDHTTCICPILQ